MSRSAPTLRRGVDALVKANPSLNSKLQLASVKGDAAGVLPRPGQALGLAVPRASGTRFGGWMFDNHQLKHLEARYEASTNQLLAGQGP